MKNNAMNKSSVPYVLNHPGNLTEEYLSLYSNGDIFIETGTFKGDTVKLAIDCGFNRVYSCELNTKLFARSASRFRNNTNVTIIQGDSIDVLEMILKQINGPATFWLDAHASGPLKGGRSGGSSVIDELRIIQTHSCKEHTIFIDDKRLFGSSEWSYVKEKDAVDLMININPKYNILYLDGIAPKDIICATVRTNEATY